MASQLNHQKLVEIQANLDTSGLDKMGADHPIYREYKNLDLTNHTMVYDGGLTMKLGDTKRVKALHVLLLEDCMMLLQKQVNWTSSPAVIFTCCHIYLSCSYSAKSLNQGRVETTTNINYRFSYRSNKKGQ